MTTSMGGSTSAGCATVIRLYHSACALNQSAWNALGRPSTMDYLTAIALLSSVVVIGRWLRG